MSTPNDTMPLPASNLSQQGESQDTCTLHVKRVPKSAWQRARENAFRSRLSFREYVISLLEQSQVVTSSVANASISTGTIRTPEQISQVQSGMNDQVQVDRKPVQQT